jgi:D-alanyl-D-alanine carboxypeptidase
LHNPDHVSSARDMAMIARALLREFPEHADLFGIGELQLGNQIITNHNGLIGRYPGADGMKTGFTCPAGFNVVASANHYGRHLLVVVLGSPTAKTRNQEAADLFDRGFAMSGGSGSLDALPDAGSRIAANSNICLHRSAAALAAAEEDGAGEPEQHTVGGGRGGAIVSIAAVSTAGNEQAHTQLSDERPQFDPVPVFIGPVPGWKGPVLAAHSIKAETAALPADAKAYVGDKASAIDDESANGQETNGQETDAPTVLKRAVRTPALAHGPKAVRNAALDGKSLKKPAGAKAAVAGRGKDAKVEKVNALKKDVKSTTNN